MSMLARVMHYAARMISWRSNGVVATIEDHSILGMEPGMCSAHTTVKFGDDCRVASASEHYEHSLRRGDLRQRLRL